MKIKITKNNEEPLLSRHKIDADLEFDKAVPTRKEVIESLAKSISAEPDLVVVKKIDVAFGTHTAKVLAYSYKNKEQRDKVEERKVLVKTGYNIPKPEKKAVAAAPAK